MAGLAGADFIYAKQWFTLEVVKFFPRGPLMCGCRMLSRNKKHIFCNFVRIKIHNTLYSKGF